jgi:hypothetical protein
MQNDDRGRARDVKHCCATFSVTQAPDVQLKLVRR